MPSLVNLGKKRASGGQAPVALSETIGRLCAAVLGLVLLYGAGFAQTEEIHNGAHDTRHSAGFPCH